MHIIQENSFFGENLRNWQKNLHKYQFRQISPLDNVDDDGIAQSTEEETAFSIPFHGGGDWLQAKTALSHFSWDSLSRYKQILHKKKTGGELKYVALCDTTI